MGHYALETQAHTPHHFLYRRIALYRGKRSRTPSLASLVCIVIIIMNSMSSKTTTKKTAIPARDPLSPLIKAALSSSKESDLKEACDVLGRELAQPGGATYFSFLDRCFGMHGQPSTRMRIDGGWVSKSSKPERVVTLLTSENRLKWDNAYRMLASFSKHDPGFALDVEMLPVRTEEYLRGDPPADVERLATDNSKRLYEFFFFARTRPHAPPTAPTTSSSSSSGSSNSASEPRTTKAGFTRLPFIVPHLDYYHFIFAYHAVYPKIGINTPVSLAYQQDLASGAITPTGLLETARKAHNAYLDLLQAYIYTYFPRTSTPQFESKNNTLDPIKALALPEDSEKFLRILIEMWLERNPCLNPNTKIHPDTSDAENQFYPNIPTQPSLRYEEPSFQVLQALLVLLPHLLARKVEVELVAQTHGPRVSRAATIPAFCAALDALQQPMFTFLSMAFRRLPLEGGGWTKFLMVVEIWLAWVTPDAQLARAFADRKGQGEAALVFRWRETFLKAYVVSNFHFYTTILMLFMRKAREALGADAAKQPVILLQLHRVLEAFNRTGLRDTLGDVSKSAGELWANGNQMRGRTHMLHHLQRLRLMRSKPCLVGNAAQDAHYLAAELLASRKRTIRTMKEQARKWTAMVPKSVKKVWFWIWEMVMVYFYHLLDWGERRGGMGVGTMGLSGVGGAGGGEVGGLAGLVLQIDAVLEEVYGIFPSVQAKCQRPLADEQALDAQLRDAERRGLLLTSEGREQLLSGQRACDPMKAAYIGDPLFDPVLKSNEYGALLPWAQQASVWLSKWWNPEYATWCAVREEEKKEEGKEREGAKQGRVTATVGKDWGHMLVKETEGIEITPISLRFCIGGCCVNSVVILLAMFVVWVVLSWTTAHKLLLQKVAMEQLQQKG